MRKFQFIFECLYFFIKKMAQIVMSQNIFWKINIITRSKNILVLEKKTGNVQQIQIAQSFTYPNCFGLFEVLNDTRIGQKLTKN